MGAVLFWITLLGGITALMVASFTETDTGNKIVGMLGASLLLLALISYAAMLETTPKAIDVYKGKTELKITYEVVNNDTIPRDSVVMFKYI